MIQTKAIAIASILADYEKNDMTPEHILAWVSQFNEDDREFILEELLHIFKKTYFSKERCKKLLKSYLEYWTKEFHYSDVQSFIVETAFLDLQPPLKSQRKLLVFLDEILKEFYGCSLIYSGQQIKRYIYLDDVLSTGGTIYKDLEKWFNDNNNIDTTKTNFQFIKDKKININVCLLCCHTWGLSNTEYRLMQSIDASVKKNINWFWFHEIQNNLKGYNQSLNHMLPINENNQIINEYLNSIDAIANTDRAFRPITQPHVDKLFSSPASRNRLETLFLVKGIEILSRVEELKVKQIRPLGYTVKSHKTFGLGTLFFSYRNIPNNCPIVFWWANNNWRPLFVLKNRGVQ